MNLNCAILHADTSVLQIMKKYIGKIPFLTLCGCYDDPLAALRDYYKAKIDVYFVGLYPTEKDGTGGMEFSRLLSPSTRVIFLADSERYAAACFRLDALDYLTGVPSFSVFSQSVCKAVRWFSHQAMTEAPATEHEPQADNQPALLFIRSDNRILCLDIANIYCVEGWGDYIKMHCVDAAKPVLTLCSMKCIEEQLPANDFIRVHRSFLVNRHYIRSIGRTTMEVNQREVPIGDAFRKNLKDYLSRQRML